MSESLHTNLTWRGKPVLWARNSRRFFVRMERRPPARFLSDEEVARAARKVGGYGGVQVGGRPLPARQSDHPFMFKTR